MNELRKSENKGWLEYFEPISKNKALFYTGGQTIHRPIIYRTHKRLNERYKPLFNTTVVFKEGKKPYSTFYSKEIGKIMSKNEANLLVRSHFGPVPIELDEMYPFAQSVFPGFVDKETEEAARVVFNLFTKNKKICYWNGNKTLTELDRVSIGDFDPDMNRISAVSDMQFGKNASKTLLNGSIKIIKSKKTGKIRNVYCNGKHVLSMRASDGMFTLKTDGAKLLHKSFKYPKLRVIVNDDAAPFIKDGKSVFARFVKDCDPDLRPLDECLIVDKKDNLLAIGRCILNRFEMLSFNYGIAVKSRESI
jgi:7-cyano-7-deazaguanine tRNA-ribosyltransferase